MKFKLHPNQSIGNAVVRDEKAEEAEMQFNIAGDDQINIAMLDVLSNLSDSIKELAIATANQKQPIVVNLIASSDEDLKKFATIFAQEIK